MSWVDHFHGLFIVIVGKWGFHYSDWKCLASPSCCTNEWCFSMAIKDVLYNCDVVNKAHETSSKLVISTHESGLTQISVFNPPNHYYSSGEWCPYYFDKGWQLSYCAVECMVYVHVGYFSEI